jgi:RNA polymerase sigma-70 factor (ECF subfamily)
MPASGAAHLAAGRLTVEAASDAGAGDNSALVARLAAGDESALREIYRRHHDEVRAFAVRLVNDQAAAEDLLHEVFVRLPRAIRRFRGEAPFRQFLIAMAVNHARHHVRAAARRRRAQRSLACEPVPPAITPDRLLEQQRLRQALVAALDRLPLDQRVAFVLCEIEERSSIEAARIVGTSDGNVRARLFHARRRLRELLAAWAGEQVGS